MPAVGNRIAQPAGTSYSDSGLSTGTYYYKVTAEDAAGNVSGASNEHTATVADATPPGAPTALAAAVAGSTVNLTWTAATDNVGVARYNLHRGTTSGFTPSAANRIAQPTGTSFSDLSVAPGSYFYKLTAEDAAGNVGPVSNTATATVADSSAPTAPTGLNATGGAGQANLTWTAATDNVGVVRYNVHRATTAGFTPSAGNRIAQPTTTSYTDVTAAGTYFYKVTAEDAAANVGPTSNEATATVAAPPTVGLVAAYGFDEGLGTTTADQSGTGNPGTIGGPVWTTSGRYGNALTFDGVNDLVTIADSASLDLTTGMTLEAWVRPTALGSAWRTALMKEATASMTYGIYAHGTDTTKVPPARSSSAPTATRRPRRRLRSTRGHTLRRPTTARARSVRQRHAGGPVPRLRFAHPQHGRASRRRQQRVGRVVPGRHRRGSRLQPRACRRRDPERHEPPGDQPGCVSADCPRNTDRERLLHRRAAELGRRERQRRQLSATTSTGARAPASRPPPATGSHSRRAPPTPTASPPAPTTTRSPPRTRPATSAARRTRRVRPSATLSRQARRAP